jgi:cytochrome c oxidase cbb3-type subunit III
VSGLSTRLTRWLACILGVALFGVFWHWLHLRSLEAELLRNWPDELTRRPDMIRFAVSLAQPLYAAHCSSCHGGDLRGNHRVGAPDLSDSIWLYGDGSIADIETSIRYGIRSGHPKAHNVTDMPPEGRTHQLSADEVRDVVEYVLALGRAPHDHIAAGRGHKLFNGKGNCYDCHANDAEGNTDYGAPSLVGPDLPHGRDRQTLYASVYSGRHGLCPAWAGKLTPAQIRALAALLYMESHADVRLARP